MPRAIWNDIVIAESDDTVVVEGNHYFPIESVKRDYLVESNSHTVCPWKGLARYYTLEVDGKCNVDAAWYYPNPSPLARKVSGRIAFWRGVTIVLSEQERAERKRRGLLGWLLRAA